MSLKTIQVGPDENRIGLNGRYLRLIEAAEPVFIRVNGRSMEGGSAWSYETVLLAGLGLAFTDVNSFPTEMQSIEIRSDIPQKIQLWAGAAAIEDNRTDGLRVSSDGVRALRSYSATATDEVTQIAPPEGGRRRVTIQVQSGSLYWGGEDVTAETGLLIDEGDSVEVETTAALYGLAVDGSVSIRLLDEVN